MQLHAALRDDPSLLGSLKRSLSRRGSLSVKKHNRDRSASTASPSPTSPSSPTSTPTTKHSQTRPSLVALDMSHSIDWSARTETWLDEPATRPAQTTLLLEIPELQRVCLNHGERQFRIERTSGISVRDILIELDKFLHRPAPKLVGNFRTAKLPQSGVVSVSTSVSVSGDADDGDGESDEQLVVFDRPRSPKAVSLDVNSASVTPDSSESSFASSSDASSGSASGKKQSPGESVLTRWLGEKTVFGGLKRAENHDFKLFVKMVKPNRDVLRV
ncbi:hypothetical protein ACEPAG_9680 [Sanghuangporus baumii]